MSSPHFSQSRSHSIIFVVVHGPGPRDGEPSGINRNGEACHTGPGRYARQQAVGAARTESHHYRARRRSRCEKKSRHRSDVQGPGRPRRPVWSVSRAWVSRSREKQCRFRCFFSGKRCRAEASPEAGGGGDKHQPGGQSLIEAMCRMKPAETGGSAERRSGKLPAMPVERLRRSGSGAAGQSPAISGHDIRTSSDHNWKPNSSVIVRCVLPSTERRRGCARAPRTQQSRQATRFLRPSYRSAPECIQDSDQVALGAVGEECSPTLWWGNPGGQRRAEAEQASHPREAIAQRQPCRPTK